MGKLIALDENEFNDINEKLDTLLNLFNKKFVNDEESAERVYSVPEAAKFMNMSDFWIYQRIKDGSLKAHRAGVKLYKIKKSDLEKLKNKVK